MQIKRVFNGTRALRPQRFVLMDPPADDLAPSYLLHRLNRIRKLPPAHPFQTVSAEKFAPPSLPNQINEDEDENQEVQLVPESQLPSLHWGAAVRATPLLPPHLGRVSRSAISSVVARKPGELVTRPTGEGQAPRLRSLYVTLPADTALSTEDVLGRFANKSAEAAASESTTGPDKAVPAQVPLIARPQTASAARAAPGRGADDSDAAGVMAVWISHRKVRYPSGQNPKPQTNPKP